ncbi:MAG: BamA/TamA family outer membrane protein [Planctomycetes bacterium]|nr:BamA/TamA family outer membrane protein [Planctomycetota bacterium]
MLLCAVLAVNLRAGEEPGPEPEPAPEGAPAEGGAVVREIEVRGNIRVDKSTVLRLIRTRVGRPFDPKIWDDDWHRLTDSGFFLNVRITPPIPYFNGVKLVIDLVEMATVKKIIFKDSSAIKDSELKGAIKTVEGGRFQIGQVHLDARAIEKLYHGKAFRDATCTYDVQTVSSHKQYVASKWTDVQDEVNITFKINEGHPISVRVLSFKGNTAFTEEQLLAVTQTKPRRLFRAGDLNEEQMETDKQRLEYWYRRAGYMDAEVKEYRIEVGDELHFNWFRKRKKLADVEFQIYEGPQYRVGNLVLKGYESLPLSEIQAVMKLKPGNVFSDVLLNDDKERIVKLYGEYGRVFTKVATDRKFVTDPERTKDGKNLYDVEMVIQEGSEVTVREVLVRGNTKTKDKVIVRQLNLFPGDRVDTTKIEQAKDQLRRLSYFEEDIRIETEPTENGEETDIVIDVTEKPTGEFNFGLGVSSVDSILGNVSLAQKNFDYKDLPKSWSDFVSGNSFVGAGQNFSIDAQAGTSRQRYSVSFYEPWAFDRPIRLGGSVFHTVDSQYKDFDETNTGFSVTAGKRLWGPRWDFDATYRFSYTTIGETDENLPSIFQDQEGSRILSSLRPRLVYDSRDSRILPSRGYFMEASIEFGGGPLLGSVDWVRPQIDVARYFTLFKTKGGGKHILELRGTAGLVESYLGTDEVPPFLRYYGGGIGTIRGFENRTISPQENGFYIGGKKQVAVTAEYSLPLYEEIVRASVFVDAGSVWDAGETDPGSEVLNDTGLRASAGIGLAIRTPLSPLPFRIFISRPLVKNDEDRTKTVDFTFGTRF